MAGGPSWGGCSSVIHCCPRSSWLQPLVWLASSPLIFVDWRDYVLCHLWEGRTYWGENTTWKGLFSCYSSTPFSPKETCLFLLSPSVRVLVLTAGCGLWPTKIETLTLFSINCVCKNCILSLSFCSSSQAAIVTTDWTKLGYVLVLKFIFLWTMTKKTIPMCFENILFLAL